MTLGSTVWSPGGCSILTYSGHFIEIPFAKDDQIHIIDIAHGLARTCRFGSQTIPFLSVAQHSVLGSYLVPERYRKAFMLHDSAEAYLGDLPSPIKRMIPQYLKIEILLLGRIADKFDVYDLLFNYNEPIKLVDDIQLMTEARDTMHPRWMEEHTITHVEPHEKRINPWGIEMAEHLYLRRWTEITGEVIEEAA